MKNPLIQISAIGKLREAIDVEGSPYTYTETDQPIPVEDEENRENMDR